MSKVVLVTGGSSGIGKAIAEHLSNKGMTAVATGRRFSQLKNENGIYQVHMDVTKPDSVTSAIEEVIRDHGRLDAVINNAGLGIAGPLESTTVEQAKEIFETNVFGILSVCKSALPHIRKTKGNIINITSLAGNFSLPYRGIYCSSKFAVEGFSEALSMEVKNQGVKVSIIQPGDFKTNISKHRKIVLPEDGTYPQFQGVLDQINAEVDCGMNPKILAKTVYRILNSKNPKLRYRVATFQQKFGIIANTLLPGRFFEKMMLSFYNLK